MSQDGFDLRSENKPPALLTKVEWLNAYAIAYEQKLLPALGTGQQPTLPTMGRVGAVAAVGAPACRLGAAPVVRAARVR